jgi:hypothetical protein
MLNLVVYQVSMRTAVVTLQQLFSVTSYLALKWFILFAVDSWVVILYFFTSQRNHTPWGAFRLRNSVNLFCDIPLAPRSSTWVHVTMAWCLLRLRLKERAFRYTGCLRTYWINRAGQPTGVIFQVRCWARSQQLLTVTVDLARNVTRKFGRPKHLETFGRENESLGISRCR